MAEQRMLGPDDVAVVIPALNEALRIREVVSGALAFCPHVIVVDDGSDDGTVDCIADLPVTVLRHARRSGKGQALRSGFAEAVRRGLRGVLTMDGDGQPVFLTEYGIGSAVDLWRATRHFEQHGAQGLEDAEFFRQKLDEFHAESRHQCEGEGHVGTGDELPYDFDGDRPAEQGQRHEERREKLAGDVAPDADGLDGDGRGRMDRERRIALVFQIVDARPKLTQSLDQIADGPLVHARHPAQAVFPVHQGEHGGERPEGRTRIA